MKIFVERKPTDKIYHIYGKSIRTNDGKETKLTLCGIKIPHFAWFHNFMKNYRMGICKKCEAIYNKNDVSSQYTFE